MIKKAISVLLQVALFLFASAAGIALSAFHLLPSHIMKLANGTRGFEWDGVVLALVIFTLILAVEAMRKQLHSAAPWTTLALLLAAILEYALKLGVRDI